MSNQEIRLPNNVKFGYQTLRTISSPDDINEERKVFAGNAPASSYLDIPENENVRDYLPVSYTHLTLPTIYSV